MLIRDILLQAVDRFPHREAVVDGDRRLTYVEFEDHVRRLAGWLSDLGIGRGDRVCIGMQNSADNVIVVMACQMLGAVTVPFNIRLKPPTIEHILSDSQARMIVLDETVDLASVQNHCTGHEALIWVDAAGSSRGVCGNSQRFAQYLSHERLEELPEVADSELSSIIYTSGTTGLPKGVAISNKATHSRLVTYIMSVGPAFDNETRTLGAAPLYHTVGLHWVYLQTLFVNGTYYPVPKVTRETLELIRSEKLSFTIGSPTLFKMMISMAGTSTLPSMRYITYGSAAAEPELLEAMYETFPNASISEFYGTTELSIPFVTPNMREFKPGTLRVAGDFRVRVVRPGGTVDDVVDPWELGELIVHLGNEGLFEGYWGPNGDKQMASKVYGEWFHTGDGCLLDGKGNYYYHGRLDDMFISGGENIQPIEVENVLNGIEKITDCAVVGVPDPVWGSVVTAFVVTSDPNLSVEAIDQICRESDLEDYKRPRKIHFVEEIPRNPSGKIVRGRIRDELLPLLTMASRAASSRQVI